MQWLPGPGLQIQVLEMDGSSSFFFLKDSIFFNSFIWLHQVLITAYGILFPDQGSNLGPLHWELRVLTTGPAEKSLDGS